MGERGGGRERKRERIECDRDTRERERERERETTHNGHTTPVTSGSATHTTVIGGANRDGQHLCLSGY